MMVNTTLLLGTNVDTLFVVVAVAIVFVDFVSNYHADIDTTKDKEEKEGGGGGGGESGGGATTKGNHFCLVVVI